jgi:hypothetical protein
MPEAIPDQSLGKLLAWSRILVRNSSDHIGVARVRNAKIAIAQPAINAHAALSDLSVNTALITLIGIRLHLCRWPASNVSEARKRAGDQLIGQKY